MAVHEFSSGGKYQLFIESGIVLENETLSHTDVHQTGGTVWVDYKKGVQVTPGTVRSHSYTTTKVWIRKADGSETQLDISDYPVPVRAGHTLAVAYAGPPEAELCHPFAAHNKMTDTTKLYGPKFYSLERMLQWGIGPSPNFGWKLFVVWMGLAVAMAATQSVHHLLPLAPYNQDLAWWICLPAAFALWLANYIFYYAWNDSRWIRLFREIETTAATEFAKL